MSTRANVSPAITKGAAEAGKPVDHGIGFSVFAADTAARITSKLTSPYTVGSHDGQIKVLTPVRGCTK